MVYICVEAELRKRLAELSGSAWKVLTIIALRMNDDRESWPSLASIAREAGLNRDTVIESIKQLESQRWISVRREDHHPNIYQLVSREIHMNGAAGVVGISDQSEKPAGVVGISDRGSRKNTPGVVGKTIPEVDTIEVDTTEGEAKKKRTPPRLSPWMELALLIGENFPEESQFTPDVIERNLRKKWEAKRTPEELQGIVERLIGAKRTAGVTVFNLIAFASRLEDGNGQRKPAVARDPDRI